jgi:pentapeptide repeat protein
MVIGALIVGAAAGFWLSEQRYAARYERAQNELVKLNQELEGEHRSRNAAELQAYFEQMTQLVLERDLHASAADSEVQRLARARTLAIVANSDAEDNRSVTRFLTELDLVKGSDSVRLLGESYLPDADLDGAYLPAADLNTSALKNANLRGALLVSANLSGAILSEADLGGANLGYANLESAELVGADLSGANLDRAVLKNADLSEADLTDTAVTEEQLDSCESLKGATMPDGSRHL